MPNYDTHPSLENLIESENIGIESLHPGGLETTKELADLCKITENSRVLDVASGTGEGTCFLVEEFKCHAVGIDISQVMITRAKEKAREKNLNIEFKIGDAHHLPFEDNEFDVVISECAVCALDKEMAIAEMIRVATPGGFIGIHDICWKEDTPNDLKVRLKEIENESPETLEGWKKLFSESGLENCSATDKSYLMPAWMKSNKQSLGFTGQLRIGMKVFQKWGIKGVKTIMETEKIFENHFTGDGIIVGCKSAKN